MQTALLIVHQVIGGEVAGGQLVALRLARAARGAGYEAAFVAPEPGAFVDLVRADGIPAHVLELGRSFRLDAALRLRSLLRAEGASLLHTHTHLAGNVLGRVAARLAGIPVISHMHIENHLRSDWLSRALQIRLDNATARLCARILAVSEATRAALERQGYPRDRLEVVRNGIELADLAAPASLDELGVPQGARVVLHVGRLCEAKGQRELIRALPALPANVHAVLVGKDLETRGSFACELEGEAERLGVRERLVLAGPRGDVPELLAACEVLALPSWIEGLPLVVLEAMAQGRPVVVSAVGGTPELVADGETGLLVPPRDPAALARALGELLGDPERAHALGEAGRRRAAAEFSAEAMAGRVLQVYRELLG